MVKARTTISIDPNLIEAAQKRLLNISGLTESAIRAKLGKTEVEISDSEVCEFCNRPGTKATRDNPKGLCWLFPDERWICDSCLISKGRHILT